MLKAGRHAEARDAFRRAVDEVASDDRTMPLSSRLLGWLGGRMHVTAQRLEGELKRHRYYAVRKGNVKGPGPMAAAVDAAMAARRGLA